MRLLPHTSRQTDVFSLLHQSTSGIVSVLFPTACPICNREVMWSTGIGICAVCRDAIKPWDGPICSRCGIPLASVAPADEGSTIRCGVCRRDGYEFDCARSYGIYAYPLRDLILQLKFRRRERWGSHLGELLAPAAHSLAMMRAGAPVLIVPVPLHPARERERGYNQSTLLAAGLHRALKRDAPRVVQLEARLLVRSRPTPPQSGLHHGARQENVRGVFQMERTGRASGRSIILVDDVMTTGATVSACAHALKRAGAKEVAVLTLARATPQFPDSHPFPPPVDDLPDGRR
ncbi:MAG: ComF family protein [Terriglobia bacterium]